MSKNSLSPPWFLQARLLPPIHLFSAHSPWMESRTTATQGKITGTRDRLKAWDCLYIKPKLEGGIKREALSHNVKLAVTLTGVFLLGPSLTPLIHWMFPFCFALVVLIIINSLAFKIGACSLPSVPTLSPAVHPTWTKTACVPHFDSSRAIY